jgi:hypothetical protein
MSLVISRRIRAREFGAEIPADAKEALMRSARVALTTPLTGKGLPAGIRLLKAYATSARGPRRIVYLLAVEDGTLFLLFYRDKNDELGANITPKNPVFASQLKKYLAWLKADIDTGKFEVIALE